MRAPKEVGFAVTISAALCAVFAVIKGFGGGLSPVNGLLLIPFFICAVSVVSALLGGEMYAWDKWKMSFEPIDADERPFAYYATLLVCMIGVIAFTIFFFRF